MHEAANHQNPQLWLIAGTGDGQQLALALEARGWRVRVSVVSGEAAQAYPERPGLVLQVGPIGGEAGIRAVLEQAAKAGNAFEAVVDASHPFARQITAALVNVWADPGAQALPPLLRLHREELSQPAVSRLRHLASLEDLAHCELRSRHLLLAIGARQLVQAVRLSPGAQHHARLLTSAAALQQGQGAGIAAERLACLRPGDPLEQPVLRALLQRWQIDTILCRQSGGVTERLWRSLAGELDLELLLLRRPAEPAGLRQLELEPLLRELEALRRAPDKPLPQSP